jgi:hypothetical protein
LVWFAQRFGESLGVAFLVLHAGLCGGERGNRCSDISTFVNNKTSNITAKIIVVTIT